MAVRTETPIDLAAQLQARGIPRRRFLRYCATLAGVLAMPPQFAHVLANGLQSAPRVPVIWLEAQDCAGNSEAFLRAEKPTVAEVLLDILSVEYHHLIMASSGTRTDEAIDAVRERFPAGYVVIVEGAIPLADGGVYCTIGGRTFAEWARAICEEALGVIAVGSCAWDGGLPAAAGGVTGAAGVSSWLGGKGPKVINMPGCPVNPENLTALIAQYLATGRWPDTDNLGRPLFAYGDVIHQRCEALPHYRAKEFVQEWGDEGHRKGWCLYQMGCKGPITNANCPTLKFNGGTSWPVAAGHGCVGCTASRFWDTMGPFHRVGGVLDLPAPTPVDYRTPVPSTPRPTLAPGETPPPGPDGGDGGDGGGDTGLYVALGAVGVAVAAGAAGLVAARGRRRDSGPPPVSDSPDTEGDTR